MAVEVASTETPVVENTATYEELADIEQEFDDVDCEVIRNSYKLSAPLYKKRENVIAKIPNFWPLVFEQAPQDLDQFITPSDSTLLAESFVSFTVTRPEIDTPNGDPRSISITMEFRPNEHFADTKLEKTLYFRRASDNWTGLVSQPTKIQWKKGKDLTKGLTDAAHALWQTKPAATNGAAKGDEKQLPEETTLKRKIELLGDESTSFFTFFAFVSERRYVSAEESAEANKAERSRRERRNKGEEVEEVRPQDDDFEEQDFEVCPHGAELAMTLAEEVWVHAIKYFVTGQELDEEDDMSDIDASESDSDEDERIDIRALVQGKRKDKASSLSPAGLDSPKKTRKA